MKKFRPGVTFSDFVIVGSTTSLSKYREPHSQTTISDWLWIGIVAAIGILFVRLVSLQLFEGGKYRLLADENRIKTLVIPAPRGHIFDRDQKILEDDLANSAVVGYTGEINEQEVGLLRQNIKYQIKDLIGRSGLQQQYESELKGANGARLVEVDNAGQIVRDLGQKKPTPGQDINTTIASDLQLLAYNLLENKKGAAVVSVPSSGEVLALVSSPGFDPTNVGKYLQDPDLPFFNRAIGGLFPPGSTFKMVTATAALSENKVSQNFSVEDVGVLTVAGFKYANWFFTQYGKTEGQVGFVKALARSNDIFFYKLGAQVGPDLIAAWATKFGFGQATGLDLPGEVSGLVPTSDWKQKFKGEAWFLGNTYHMAIGQGDVLATPLQVNLMTNILATGKKCKPYIARGSTSPLSFPSPKLGEGVGGEVCPNVGISSEILDIIKQGMVGACKDGGTAYPFFDWQGPAVACKTGTAEYLTTSGKYGTHAWFTIYAPVENPQISVTILVEGGGEGSKTAAPIARKILAKFFGIEDHYNYTIISGVGE